jgi:ABC-2 type transport system ATP-binding protein
MLRSLTLVKQEKRGSLYTLTVRGERDEIIAMFAAAETHFYEVLPLSLEEIFISETEVKGYDVKKLLLG